MIPNVTRGGKTHGVLLYLVGKGKREEHENPHLVAGSPEAVRMAESSSRSSARTRSRWRGSSTSRERRSAPGSRSPSETRARGESPAARDAHVWHCSLLCTPRSQSSRRRGGRRSPRPSSSRWGSPAGRPARRSAGGSRSATAAPPAAQTMPTWSSRSWPRTAARPAVHNDRPRAQKACRELEQRYGLRRLEARTREAGSRGLKHGELAADRRRGRQLGERGEHSEWSTRQTLERIVRACATASRDESEFIQRLRDEGIKCRPRFRRRRHGRGRRLLGPPPRPRRGPQDCVVRRRPPRPRPDPAGPAARLGPDRGGTQGAINEWS